MSDTTRITEPTSVTQGEQIEWTRGFCDYPASEWTLQYRFRGPDTGFNIAATADGDDFNAVLTAANSAASDAGQWKWQAWATNIADTSIVLMIGSGDTEIRRGFPSSTAEIDLRTPAKIMLDTLDAALLASGSADVVEYEITTPAGGRRVKRESRSTVLEQRKYWATIVTNEFAREAARNGRPLMQSIKMVVYDD